MLDLVLSNLPKEEQIKIRSEADYYGTSCIISKKLRLPFALFSPTKWVHGWRFKDLKYIEQLTGSGKGNYHLVALKEHETFLKNNGLKSKAVGMPFIYVEDVENIKIKRIPNSLLIMPPHTLSYVEQSWDESEYIKLIGSLKSDFELIVVCIHPECYKKGYWIEACEKFKLPYIKGASLNDKNSLIRMYRLFSSFEYMTTCHIGSHVLYAAYCDCKVSIYGNYFKYKKEFFTNDPFYRKYPHILERNLKIGSESYIRKKFPQFFVSPKDAKIMKKWADKEIGLQYKIPAYKVAYYLGWFSLHKQLKCFLTSLIKYLTKKILMCYYFILDYIFLLLFAPFKNLTSKKIAYVTMNIVNRGYILKKRLNNYYFRIHELNIFREDYFKLGVSIIDNFFNRQTLTKEKKIIFFTQLMEIKGHKTFLNEADELFYLKHSKDTTTLVKDDFIISSYSEFLPYFAYFDTIYAYMSFEFLNKNEISSLLEIMYKLLNNNGSLIILYNSYYDRFGSKIPLFINHPWPQFLFNSHHYQDYCRERFKNINSEEVYHPYDYIVIDEDVYSKLNNLSQIQFEDIIKRSNFKIKNRYDCSRAKITRVLHKMFPKIKIFDTTSIYVLNKI